MSATTSTARPSRETAEQDGGILLLIDAQTGPAPLEHVRPRDSTRIAEAPIRNGEHARRDPTNSSVAVEFGHGAIPMGM
jgi:hypothetical protein